MGWLWPPFYSILLGLFDQVISMSKFSTWGRPGRGGRERSCREPMLGSQLIDSKKHNRKAIATDIPEMPNLLQWHHFVSFWYFFFKFISLFSFKVSNGHTVFPCFSIEARTSSRLGRPPGRPAAAAADAGLGPWIQWEVTGSDMPQT